MAKITLSSLFLVAAVALILSGASAQNSCTYSINIQTGNVKDAGTDSVITFILTNQNGQAIRVNNIEDWGNMAPHHDYFERGQLDRFSGNAECISTPFCAVTIISDGSGNKPGWFLQSVMVSLSNSAQISNFDIKEWIQPGHWSTTKRIC